MVAIVTCSCGLASIDPWSSRRLFCLEIIMLNFHEERMSDAMVKYHIEGLERPAVIHRFTSPDFGPHHDHPWPFYSFVISGGYVEEVFDLEDGDTHLVRRSVGQSFYIPETHIHRIVELPNGICETIILPFETKQKSGFWEFRDDGTYHRFWDGDWEKVK